MGANWLTLGRNLVALLRKALSRNTERTKMVEEKKVVVFFSRELRV